ncbi:T9SS type A sorting domain-containing protein [Cryomorphaceae bacterium 1068]|nr:T9SS type A sorting domain-containing protein [Cryomorphaceae bacterium 1068]
MIKIDMKKGMLTAFTFLSGMTLLAQGVCTNFSYYYADINYPASGGTETDIYSVSLEGEDAILSAIVEDIPNAAHIAYNEMNGLIYVVNGTNGSISTLDPSTGVLSEEVSVSPSVGITVAAFDAEGNLLIGGSANDGKIYVVDLGSNPYTLSDFSDGNDIQGGDITFGASGSLYLASKPEGKLYEVIPGFENTVLGNVNGEVTGIATLEDGGSIIVSSRNNGQFLTYDVDGGFSESTAYNAILNGEPFTLENGDMASGCSERSTSIEGCSDLRTYYMEDAVGGGSDILYSVNFNEMGGADLVELGTFGAGSHIGVGPNGLIYIVRYGSGMLTTWDPETLASVNEVQINVDGSNIGQIPAVVAGDDGFVYVGSQAGDIIYKVDPTTGNATIFGEANVGGGDLVFVDGALWCANRGLGRFFEVNGEGEFDVAAEEINGVANLPDGNLLISNGNLNGLFEVYEPGTGIATGETFETGLELFNGDLASRCFDGNQGSECENFQLFLSANGNQGGDIYRVTLGDGSASLELLLEGLGDPHLAYDEINGLLYIVKGSGDVAIYDPVTDVLSTFSNIAMGDMNVAQTYAAVVTEEGTLLVGSANQNKVYEVNPATGEASNAVDVPVSGGDIIQTNDGDVWLINRSQNRFYNITDGVSQFDVDLNQMYGAAVMESGMILVGNAGTQLRVVDPATASVTETVYNIDINVSAGDLAGGCGDANPEVTPEPGECYVAEAFDYVEGVRSNGGAIATNRTDSTQAEGMPEGIDQLVFVTLGYGGSIKLDFNGAVPNLDGDDLEVVETSYGNPGCDAYPEYADVYVSQNGVDFFFAETVCKSDNGVDISAAGDFDYITVVEIRNNDTLTSTPDGYDLDGVRAIWNCEGTTEEENEPGQSEGDVVQFVTTPSTIINSYPNPTEGQATIEFSVGQTERAVVEIFDMNGRSVETLFNQDVQAGNTYRLAFDGGALPNGIYVVKFVTESQTVIEKIMIAR